MAQRFDTVMAPEWLYSRFEKTPEGYLRGRAVICSTGVYDYQRGDGTLIRELRLPEEVFAPAFLDSLRMKPITLYHPDVMVTAENIKEFQIGTIGNSIDSDGYHVSVDMIIHDADAIKEIEAGTRELSVGYTCDLEAADTPDARWCGQGYDYIQRNILANHLSVVPKARAGDAARIRLDSADAILIQDRTGGEKMPDLKTIKLDGVEYQAESKVLEALHVAQTKADGLATELADTNTAKTKIEAERDTLKDRVDALDAKVKELESKKLDEAVVAAAVARRVRILDAARVAEVEVKDGMSELDIQKAVIVKVFPKANLDDKSAEYIDARFDGAIEALAADAEEKANADNRAAAGGAENADAAAHADAGNVVDSREARKKMIEALRNGYRGDSK